MTSSSIWRYVMFAFESATYVKQQITFVVYFPTEGVTKWAVEITMLCVCVSASHHFTFETVCWFSRYLFYICRHWRTPQHRTFNFLWWVISAREMLEIMGREWQYRSVYLGCESSALRVKFSTHNTTCCHIASFNIGISNEILIKVILARN
jgi:hypothetical protein